MLDVPDRYDWNYFTGLYSAVYRFTQAVVYSTMGEAWVRQDGHMFNENWEMER